MALALAVSMLITPVESVFASELAETGTDETIASETETIEEQSTETVTESEQETETTETEEPEDDPSILESGVCGDDLTWTFDVYGTLSVMGTGAIYDDMKWGTIYLDDCHQILLSDGITSIGDNAFSAFSEVKEITIPDTVTHIGEYAFSSCGFVNLVIPDSVTEIEPWAFSSSDSIESVVISANLRKIPDYAFDYCNKLEQVTIQSGVQEIGINAFRECNSLTNITIPGTVSTIGTYAFYDCDSLTEVVLEEGVSVIEENAFDNCRQLSTISMPESLTAIHTCAFRYCSNLQNITIPEKVKAIEKSTFYNCSSLKNVVISDGVEIIDENAFSYCHGLSGVDLPESVKSIGSLAFSRCTALSFATIRNLEADIHDQAFLSDTNLTIYGYLKSTAEAFADSKKIPFEYLDETININKCTVSAFSYKYTGEPILAKVVAYCRDQELQRDTDFTVTYENNIEAGDATAIVTGHGKYYGTATQTFWISPIAQKMTASISSSTVMVGGTVKITANGIGTISYVSENPEIASVDNKGVVTGKTIGTTTITVSAEGDNNHLAATKTFDVESKCLDEPRLTNIETVGGYVRITWDAVPGAQKYRVLRMEEGQTEWTKIADTTSTQYTDTSVAEASTYSYTVQCVSSDGQTEMSQISEFVLSATTPEIPKLTKIENITGGIKITWKKVDSVYMYRVFRKTAGTGWKKLMDIGSNSSSITYSDMTVEKGCSYTYTVRGLDDWEGYSTAYDKAGISITFPSTTSVVAKGTCGSKLTWKLESDGTLTISGTGAMTNFDLFDGPAVPWSKWSGNITHIVLPNGITSIGSYSFLGCSNVRNVSVPASVTLIGTSAFDSSRYSQCQVTGHCGKNVKWTIYKGVLTLSGNGAMPDWEGPWEQPWSYCCSTDIEKVVIEPGVTSISNYAFVICEQMTQISIPSTVTHIGNCAFEACHSLKSISIPNSVKTLGYSVFSNCDNLTSVKLPSGLKSLSSDLFMSCTSLKTVEIPSTVTAIYSGAFSYCSKLASITIPSGVKQIGADTFQDCRSLKSVTLPCGITTIESGLFSGCTSLSSVMIPPTVTTIDSAFGGCTSLKSIKIPASVKKFHGYNGFGHEYVVFEDISSIVIYGYKGSTAEAFAKHFGYTFKTLQTPMLLDPVLTNAKNVNGGVQFTWKKVTGAAKYRVYRKTGNGSWTKIADTTGVSYTDKTVKSGTKYTYTARCITRDGKSFTSGFDNRGKSVIYIAAPVINKLENINGGVKITWAKSAGAAKYRIYRKTGTGSWAKLSDTTALTYTDTTTKSGTKYSYTIRCLSSNAKTFTSSYDNTGKSITYIATPVLRKVENVNGGVKITWAKSNGAAKYRVYRKTGSGSWTKLGDTTAVSYTDKKAVSGTKYTYTVRCLSSDAKSFTSSYDQAGKTIIYYAAPVLGKIQNVNYGVKISWESVTGAVKYRVYRKTGSGSWTRIADTDETTFTDGTVSSGTTYIYTVRCLSSDGKTLISSFDSTGKTITYLSSPVLISAEQTNEGILIRWENVTGAANYRVYRKTSDTGWKKIADTTASNYTDSSVGNQNEFIYTVRCISADGKSTSGYDPNGISVPENESAEE